MATDDDPLTIIVDDSDTDIIIYSEGDWQTGGAQGEFNHTTHGTSEVGASCTFIFNGTSVSVYGTVAASNVNVTSNYNLDGSPVQTFSSPVTKSKTTLVQFYQAEALTYTTHTLVITAATNFYLDFILYTIPPPAMPPVGSTSPIAGYIGLSTSLSINAASISPSLGTQVLMKSSHPSPMTPHSPKPVGAIVGGTLSGVVIILAAVVLILYFRRHKAPLAHKNSISKQANTEQVVPFPLTLRTTRLMRKTDLEKEEVINVAAVPLRMGHESVGGRSGVIPYDDRGARSEAEVAELVLPCALSTPGGRVPPICQQY